ncbi:hypothetical protein [Ornithinimicrobium sp. LYQ103]|uniref:hypothetical protein n=1 Tax=Ornithinimicrobium sp. LYQ103 TaxID=3378796 RepID=UPI0038532D5D
MPNLSLQGTAGVALTFDGDVFCSAHAAQVGRVRGEQRPCRPDRPWRAHDGPITRYATGDQPPLRCEMMVLSLPGRRRPLHPERRFATFAGDGRIVDALQKTILGAGDGQVICRHGLHSLIGSEQDDSTQLRDVHARGWCAQ